MNLKLENISEFKFKPVAILQQQKNVLHASYLDLLEIFEIPFVFVIEIKDQSVGLGLGRNKI